MDQYYVVIGIFATLTSTARIVLGGVSFVDCWYVNEFSHFEAQIMMIYLIGEKNVKIKCYVSIRLIENIFSRYRGDAHSFNVDRNHCQDQDRWHRMRFPTLQGVSQITFWKNIQGCKWWDFLCLVAFWNILHCFQGNWWHRTWQWHWNLLSTILLYHHCNNNT